MKDLQGTWALVTGASSGFGIEFAKLLAKQNANLVLVARRAEPMNKLAEELRKHRSVQVVVIAMDLSRSGAAAELKADLDHQGIAIEILINNAGFGMHGAFLDQSLDKITEMMRLNMMTVTELTHIFGREMAKRQSGSVLLVASLLGYQAVPGYASYAASKAFVLLLGEALHQEFARLGVTVTTLCPGLSATGFSDVAGQQSSPFLKLLTMQPEPVAQIGLQAMLQSKTSVVPGILNKATVFLDRLMPRKLQSNVLGNIMSGERNG